MPEQEDPHKLADPLEREADRLERESDELGEKLEATRQDWEHKRTDESVPGAPPPDGQEQPRAPDQQ
jgi:hypothetical protein